MSGELPPPVIKAEDLRVERKIENGQVVSYYVSRATGQPVPLAETFHLKGAKLDPPPS